MRYFVATPLLKPWRNRIDILWAEVTESWWLAHQFYQNQYHYLWIPADKMTITHQLAAHDVGGVVVPVSAADFALNSVLGNTDAPVVRGVVTISVKNRNLQSWKVNTLFYVWMGSLLVIVELSRRCSTKRWTWKWLDDNGLLFWNKYQP